MNIIYYYQSPIGKIGIAERNRYISNLFFEKDIVSLEDCVVKETDTLREANEQLQEYLCGVRREFSLRLSPAGTPYMKAVWNRLCMIPYGSTRSYQDIAKSMGSPKAYRAVGLANSKNPIPVFIPCHRVIGEDGDLTGYRGGLPLKYYLLEMEKRYGNL